MDPERRARLRRHLRLIDEGVAPVLANYRRHIQCAPGCSQCCHQSFRVSELEGELLREGLSTLDEPTRNDILRRARAYVPDQRTPCPVLSNDGRCRLYEHRPRICRKYGIPLWNPERPHEVTTCELNFRGVTDLDPDLIAEPQAHWAEDWLTLRTELTLPPQQNQTIATHLLTGPASE